MTHTLRHVLACAALAMLGALGPSGARAEVDGSVAHPDDQRVIEQLWPSGFRLGGDCVIRFGSDAPQACGAAAYKMVDAGAAGLAVDTPRGQIILGGFTRFDPEFLDPRSRATSALRIDGMATLDGRDLKGPARCWITLSGDLKSRGQVACQTAEIRLTIAEGPLTDPAPALGSTLPAKASVSGCGTLTLAGRALTCTSLHFERDADLRTVHLSFDTADGPLTWSGRIAIGPNGFELTVGDEDYAGSHQTARGVCSLAFGSDFRQLATATCDVALVYTTRTASFELARGAHAVEAQAPPIDPHAMLADPAP